MALQYRPEIDGLRAVAVVPVILFHAGFSLFSGGFIGVDVFFVISGYLITSIILKELEARTFSFASFYEMRARRILPALFLVMLCCIPFAWMWMLPTELKGFAVSVASVVAFASNIIFWRQSGYFDTAAELKPLLHTWSLAVEEQFYIIFPIALLLMWRFGRRASVLSIAVVAAVSFLLCEYASRNHPSFNFYWAITRAWELMAGSLCAFATIRPHKMRDDVLSAVGLALIIASIFLFDNSTRFPSAYALLPVGGACLIILFGNRATFAARLLSKRPIVGIGLISYSAYLWHQPLFAFARIRSITEPSMWLMAGLALAVFPLAWLTWRYVETPFRNKGKLVTISRPRLIRLSSATAIGLFGFGVAGHLTWGYPLRLSTFDKAVMDAATPVWFGCRKIADCYMGDPTGLHTGIAFVGDSHMGRYAYAINAELLKSRKKAIVLEAPMCPPLLDFHTKDPTKNAKVCGEIYQKELAELLRHSDIKNIVLASQWANYTTGTRFRASTSVYDFSLDGSENKEVNNNPGEFRAALLHTIRIIRSSGKKAYIIGPVPEYNFAVPHAIFLKQRPLSGVSALERSRAEYLDRNKNVLSAFELVIKDDDSVQIIDISLDLCDEKNCFPLNEDGLPLYNDGNHLTALGLSKVLRRITKKLEL